MELLVGFITGILWGYIFQRARILRFEKHIGLLTFTDLTVFKFLLSGVVVGTLGINLLATLGPEEGLYTVQGLLFLCFGL